MQCYDVVLIIETCVITFKSNYFTCKCEALQCCDRGGAFGGCVSPGRGGSRSAPAGTPRPCAATSNTETREPERRLEKLNVDGQQNINKVWKINVGCQKMYEKKIMLIVKKEMG